MTDREEPRQRRGPEIALLTRVRAARRAVL